MCPLVPEIIHGGATRELFFSPVKSGILPYMTFTANKK
jgi:hypothetical protein